MGMKHFLENQSTSSGGICGYKIIYFIVIHMHLSINTYNTNLYSLYVWPVLFANVGEYPWCLPGEHMSPAI